LLPFLLKRFEDMTMKSIISKKMAALIFFGAMLGLANTSASALTLEARWEDGTAAALETPTNVTMNKFGWGAVFNVPAASSAWVHLALPTPVIEDGVRTKLFKALVQYNGNAVIDQVDVWDGPTRIASQAVNWTGNHLAFGNWGTVIIPGFPQILYGVNISLHVKNNCPFGVFCLPQSMNLVSAGGDFYR
jgi:hypothetical protein